MTVADAFIWAVFAVLGMAGIVLLSGAVTQGASRSGNPGQLRITRRRTQDRVNTVTLFAMAAWIAASGVLLYRVNELMETSQQGLDETGRLQLEVAELRRLVRDAVPAAVVFTPPAAGEVATGQVNTGALGMPLMLRESPAGMVIAQVEGGAVVTVLSVPEERVNGRSWISVRAVDGRTGWVAAENIRAVRSLDP